MKKALLFLVVALLAVAACSVTVIRDTKQRLEGVEVLNPECIVGCIASPAASAPAK